MSKQPNVLFIMSDQQRFDSLGCYGCRAVPTPNLDRLAEEGVLFENCYANNTICTPSRASVFTGKPLPGHSVYRLHDIMPKDQSPFPKHLKEKGYRTAIFGKLHVSGRIHEKTNRLAKDIFDIYEYTLSPHDLTGPHNAYAKWLKQNIPNSSKD